MTGTAARVRWASCNVLLPGRTPAVTTGHSDGDCSTTRAPDSTASSPNWSTHAARKPPRDLSGEVTTGSRSSPSTSGEWLTALLATSDL